MKSIFKGSSLVFEGFYLHTRSCFLIKLLNFVREYGSRCMIAFAARLLKQLRYCLRGSGQSHSRSNNGLGTILLLLIP